MAFDPITTWHVPERAHLLAETLGDGHDRDVVRHARALQPRRAWRLPLGVRPPRIRPLARPHPASLWRRLPWAHAKT